MEEDIKVQVCRLCFNLISDKSFSTIQDSIKDMLQVMTTDLDLDLTNLPVMCLECSKSLEEVYNFKINFFEAEEKINLKLADVKRKKSNLRDIMNNAFNERSTRKSTRAKLRNNELCRTCLQTIEGNTFISLNKTANTGLSSMLDSCLPKLDLNVTSDPVMCQTCHKTLQKMSDFKAVCEKNESQLKKYMRRVHSSLTKKVNLHSVLEFLYNPGTMSDSPGVAEVKTEPSEGNGVVKSEASLDQGELKDYSEFITVKAEPIDEETVTQQIKLELKEEVFGPDNDLECVTVKMESTYGEEETDQCKIKAGKNNVDLKKSSLNATKQDAVKPKRKYTFKYRLPSKKSDKASKEKQKKMTTCSGCGYEARFLFRLKRHLDANSYCKLIVTQENPHFQNRRYECDKCDFVAWRNLDLTRHNMSSHIKPEAFQCSRCTFSTKVRSQLLIHILNHAKVENIDKYSNSQLPKKAQ